MVMCSQKNKTAKDDNLGRLTRIIEALSPKSLRLAETMLSQLAEQEGIEAGSATSMLKTPAEGIPIWLAHLRQESYSENSISVYMSSLKALFEAHPNPARLDVIQWLAKRMETRSPTAVSTDRKAIRSLFSFMKEEGLWPSDPTEKLKSIKVPKRMRDAPSLPEVMKMMEYECWRKTDSDKFHTMTKVIATTGIRLDEACSIRKDRIFPDKHEMVVIGKGNKERTVPLVPVAEAIIAEHLAKYPAPDSPYLFPGDTPKGYACGDSYEKTLGRACRAAKIRHYTPHQLRHFFATYTLQHGGKLEVVSRMLGHASIGTTGDIYRHVLTDEMHDTSRLAGPMAKDQPLRLADPRIVEGEAKQLGDGQ